MSLKLEWELDKKAKADRKAEQLEVRKMLVKPDPKSRPRFMASWVWRWIMKVKASPDRAQLEKAEAIVEKIFVIAAWAAWILVIVLIFADVFLHGANSKSALSGDIPAGSAVSLIGILLLVLIMFDLGSYRPRVFAECLGPPDVFFRSLAELSSELEDHVTRIANERPKSWRLVKELEQGLIVESRKFIFPDGIRTQVSRRVLQRLAGLVASLALLGYGLSAATHGDLLTTCSAASQACAHKASVVTLPEHFYFSISAFFTGFSNIQLVRDVAGYAYLIVVVVSITAVVYFFLTDVVSSHAEFRANMLAAAESFVLQQSRL
jgi:hypothetical protein